MRQLQYKKAIQVVCDTAITQRHNCGKIWAMRIMAACVTVSWIWLTRILSKNTPYCVWFFYCSYRLPRACQSYLYAFWAKWRHFNRETVL